MSEYPLCQFKPAGIAAFRDWLARVRAGDEDDLPDELLFDDEYAVPAPGGVTVDAGVFDSRLQAVRYLSAKVAGVRDHNRFFNVGLWSWLSAFYRDSTMPADEQGRRHPGQDYRHLLSGDSRNRHRHLLSYPTQVHMQFGEMPQIIFAGHVDEANKISEELGSRQALALNQGVLEAANHLYWDVQRGRIKRGVLTGRKTPGALGRFIDVISQIDLTYDLYAMSGEQILRLLPQGEFGRWLSR